MVEAYDGQPVACLVGTDAAYDEWGATWWPRCARPVPATSSWPAAADLGADDHCHAGIDALDFLRRTREVLS